ncbi:MAG TPA: S8 family serine peptidase [Steroidobacteraceae bacterium]|nr:S8 family serine peptidase [Steroidobacteraceae bacterium]
MQRPILPYAAAALCLTTLYGAPRPALAQLPAGFPCQPLVCSSLLPATPVDPQTNDCAYRAGNLWWVDYVAGSLAWSEHPRTEPVTVAIFDDGAWTDHEDLRNQLWTNATEEHGKPGVDDDGNGYVDDLHGWDFVDDSPDVSPKGVCRDRVSHGTLMASLVAAQRNNGVGIAAPGSDGARVMILRITGCEGDAARVDPVRLIHALHYATRMGAKILSFSAHWDTTTPELDAAFREIADQPDSPVAAIVVASVPNKGEPAAGYPAAYDFRRIVRAIPIGNDDQISPGTSPAPSGLNLGAPSACVIGAGRPPGQYRLEQGSSNSTAILAGLLAGIWSSPRYAKLGPDEFLARVVAGRMSTTARRSKPGSRPPYLKGVPLADACLLATERRSASVCHLPEAQREARP